MVFTYLRLAKLFSDYQSRLCCVQARLQAISILIYSHTVQVRTKEHRWVRPCYGTGEGALSRKMACRAR